MRLASGIETAAHFGSVEAEHEALRHAAGLIIRDWVDHLEVRGEDRRTYLNGKVTCDLGGLTAGEGAYGFILDAKGHIQADAAIRWLEDAVWLELPGGRGADIAEHLRRFVVVDRVEIEPLVSVVPLTLVGPLARPLLESLAGEDSLPDRPWRSGRVSLGGGGEFLISADGRWGEETLTLWPSAVQVEGLVGCLLDAGRPIGLRRVGYRAADLARIEAGIPWFGRDFGTENLPQETGQTEGVSYTKGCYLGQEVVARLHYRGRVSRISCGVTFALNELPEPGTPLVLEGRQAGVVTSAARSPRDGSLVGLAMLQRRAAEVGTRLQVGSGGAAAVVRSPLVD